MAHCDLCASVVGGDALRLHFQSVSGRDKGQRMDLGKTVNDRNYTVLWFTMQRRGLSTLSPSAQDGQTSTAPFAPVYPGLSHRLKETGK